MSLSEQLKELQIPGQSVIQQLNSKKLSILFDVKTAASLDNEAILNIGRSGFQEMVAIDPLFDNFSSLFEKDSVRFQRNMITKTEEKNLKQKISNFLLYLSPYLLIKPSHKCLEWLVRRFQIHVFDKNAFIACILPFHESQIFSRIIQLFGTKESGDMWDWLIVCQKEGAGFNTQTLIKHCKDKRNRNLLNFVLEMAINADKAVKLNPKSCMKLVFSFYARTLACVLDSFKVLKEELVSFLLPQIHAGLQSTSKDFISATYMIMGMVCLKTTLSKDVCKAFVSAVIKSMQTSWYKEGLLCLIGIMLHQKVKYFSQRAYNNFMNLDMDVLMSELKAIHSQLEIDHFLNSVIISSCNNIFEETGKTELLLKMIIDEFQLNKPQLDLFFRELLQAIIKKLNDGHNDIIGMADLLKLLSTRYSTVFDSNISMLHDEYTSNDDKESLASLEKIISICLSTSKYQSVETLNMPLVVSINHPEAKIRSLAIDHLFNAYKENIDTYNEEFYQNCILSRFTDESDDIIIALLKYSKQIVKILSPDQIINVIETLINRSSDQYFKLNILLVHVLENSIIESVLSRSNKFVYVLFYYIFNGLLGKHSKKLIDGLSNVSIATDSPMINGIFKTITKIDKTNFGSLNNLIYILDELFSITADEFVRSEKCCEFFQAFWEYKSTLPLNHNFHFIGLLLLDKIVTRNLDIFSSSLDSLLCNLLLQCEEQDNEFLVSLEVVSSNSFDSTCIINKFAEEFKNGRNISFDLNHLANILLHKNLINALSKCKGNVDYAKVRKSLFVTLANHSSVLDSSTKYYYRYLLSYFFANIFSTKEESCFFLCSMYSHILVDENHSEEDIRTAVLALSLLAKLFSEDDISILENDKDSKLITSVIVLLQNRNRVIREVASNTIMSYYNVTRSKKKFPWNYIFEKIEDSLEEIKLDRKYLKRLFENTLTVKKEKENDLSTLMNKSRVNKSSKKQSDFATLYFKKLRLNGVALQKHMLDVLEYVKLEPMWDECLKIMHTILEEEGNISLDQEYVLLKLLNHLSEEYFQDITQETVECFIKCMSSNSKLMRSACFQMITPSFYGKLSSSLQLKLIESLLKVLLSSTSVEQSTKIRIAFKNINISSEHNIHFMNNFCLAMDKLDTSNASLDQTSKEQILQSDVFRSSMEILEAMSSKKSFQKVDLLISSSSNVLERLVKFADVEFEYHCQLCLSILLSLMEDIDINSSSLQNDFKASTLIHCLQNSKDIQTCHLSLKVLSKAVVLFPSQVLHSVIHIFTFIGGNLIRVDNEYSYEIIKKTIDSVVPVLMKKRDTKDHENKRKRTLPDSSNEMISLILHTFIDSLPYCPDHRRLHILTHLLQVIGVESYLHTVILLLIKTIIKRTSTIKDDTTEEIDLSSFSLDFCKYWVGQYHATAQLNSLKEIFSWLNSFGMPDQPAVKRKKGEVDITSVILSMESLTEKQVKVLKYTILKFACEIIESEEIITAYQRFDKKGAADMTGYILRLLEELLQYTEKLGKLVNSIDDIKSKKFTECLQMKSQYLIGNLYALLPFDSFIDAVSELIKTENHLVRKKSLELLYSKLEGVNSVEEHSEKQLLIVFTTLVKLVQFKENDEEPPMNKQLMLLVMKQVAMLLCVKHKELFTQAIPNIVQLYAVEESNPLVAMSAILCTAEITLYLKADILPYMAILMKPLISKIPNDTTETSDDKDIELLITTFLVAIEKLLKSIPQFLSSYVPDILLKLSICAKNENPNMNEKLVNVTALIGQHIPARVLYPAIESGIDGTMAGNERQVTTYLEVLKSSFDYISKADANTNFNKTLQSIIKKSLNMRSTATDKDIIFVVENHAIDAFCRLILKLSENSLRPMYLGLFTWATSDDEKHTNRILSFYRLSTKLSKELKSLYLLFATHVLKHSTEVLTNYNSKALEDDKEEIDTTAQKEIIAAVLDTLSNVFYYDHQGFIDKEKFDSMMKPLINQLENDMFDEDYSTFVSDHLCHCIVSFAAAVNDATCWKALNHHLLLKTKHSDVKVRLASLQVTQEIYTRLGESYMILVPETIPFLAEVLEDDSMEVENMGHKVIKQIEEITGESLQKYF